MKDSVNDMRVSNRQEFVKFIDLLRKDFLANPESWENKTLPDFLEALSAYADDIQGYYDNIGQVTDANQPAWQVFADIFKGAIIYE